MMNNEFQQGSSRINSVPTHVSKPMGLNLPPPQVNRIYFPPEIIKLILFNRMYIKDGSETLILPAHSAEKNFFFQTNFEIQQQQIQTANHQDGRFSSTRLRFNLMYQSILKLLNNNLKPLPS